MDFNSILHYTLYYCGTKHEKRTCNFFVMMMTIDPVKKLLCQSVCSRDVDDDDEMITFCIRSDHFLLPPLCLCVSLSSLQLLQCTHTKTPFLLLPLVPSYALSWENLSETQFFCEKNSSVLFYQQKTQNRLDNRLFFLIPFFPVCFYPLSKKCDCPYKIFFIHYLCGLLCHVLVGSFIIMNGPFKKLVRSFVPKNYYK
jgi:hypothetical protein